MNEIKALARADGAATAASLMGVGSDDVSVYIQAMPTHFPDL